MRRFLFAFALTSAVVLTAGTAAADDGEMAQQIAVTLRESGALRDYSIGVKYKNGVAWLSGQVKSNAQMSAAVQIAKGAPGVKKVVNKIAVIPSDAPPQEPSAVQAASFHNAARKGSPQSVPRQRRADSRPPRPIQVNYPASASNYPAAANNSMPNMGAMPNMGGGMSPMPAYVPGTGQGIHPAVYDQPNLPNYAWPSYAAYPNYAALTYPQQYSPTAWPYIGPFYPYPQVPLAWRKVALEWDDGWWFLDFYDRSSCY